MSKFIRITPKAKEKKITVIQIFFVGRTIFKNIYGRCFMFYTFQFLRFEYKILLRSTPSLKNEREENILSKKFEMLSSPVGLQMIRAALQISDFHENTRMCCNGRGSKFKTQFPLFRRVSG